MWYISHVWWGHCYSFFTLHGQDWFREWHWYIGDYGSCPCFGPVQTFLHNIL